MNQKYLRFFIAVIAVIIAIAVYYFSNQNVTSSIVENQPPKQQITKPANDFRYDEVIKEKISVNGGVLRNLDQSVVVTIPPLKQETEFTLSFKKSDFEVKSGVRSPVTIILSTDTNLSDLSTPIDIKIKYDSQYNLPVPYLISENNKLQSVNIGTLNKENHYFTINTFHGGTYSWIYAN